MDRDSPEYKELEKYRSQLVRERDDKISGVAMDWLWRGLNSFHNLYKDYQEGLLSSEETWEKMKESIGETPDLK